MLFTLATLAWMSSELMLLVINDVDLPNSKKDKIILKTAKSLEAISIIALLVLVFGFF